MIKKSLGLLLSVVVLICFAACSLGAPKIKCGVYRSETSDAYLEVFDDNTVQIVNYDLSVMERMAAVAEPKVSTDHLDGLAIILLIFSPEVTSTMLFHDSLVLSRFAHKTPLLKGSRAALAVVKYPLPQIFSIRFDKDVRL